MAMVTAAIANGGTVYEPRVVNAIVGADGETVRSLQPQIGSQLNLDPETHRLLTLGMGMAVLGGTAGNAWFREMQVAGKTGTAEFGDERLFRGNFPTHGWFVGFAPFEQPEIAIVVFHELGAGFLTAEAGGDIMRAWAEQNGKFGRCSPRCDSLPGSRKACSRSCRPSWKHACHDRSALAKLRSHSAGRCAGLTGYGALLIYSATLPRGTEGLIISEEVARHIGAALAGATLMFVTARLNYRNLGMFGWLAYGTGIVLLLMVLAVGSEQFGSRRWFDLGFTLVQASEIAKLLTIIGLAKYLSDRRDRIHEWRVFLTSFGLALLPALLVFVEPDAGSAVVFLMLWAVMAAFAGVPLRKFSILARSSSSSCRSD